MKKITFISLLALFFASYSFSQKRVVSNEIKVSEAQNSTLLSLFEEYKVVEIDLKKFREDISSPKETRMLWKIDGSTEYDIKIHPEEIRSPSFQASIVSEKESNMVEKGEIVTYKGYLSSGNPVRLTVDNDFIYGGIQEDEGHIMIKQLRYILNDQSISPGKLVLYHSKDVKDEGGYCAVPDVSESPEKDEGGVTTQSTNTGCRVIEVALDCDDDYENVHGNNSINQMLGEINMIRGIYEDELDAIISVTAAFVFTGSQYTSTNSNTILTEINTLWTTSPQSGISRDLVHHFSGKILLVPIGRILGQASGSVCVATNPRCFTADREDGFYTVAHEIGHLLTAIHSDGVNCGSSTTQSIMCSGEVNQMFFSAA